MGSYPGTKTSLAYYAFNQGINVHKRVQNWTLLEKEIIPFESRLLDVLNPNHMWVKCSLLV